jgi:hypothetical protein
VEHTVGEVRSNSLGPDVALKGYEAVVHVQVSSRAAGARSGVSRGRFTTPADTNKRLALLACLRPRCAAATARRALAVEATAAGRPLGLAMLRLKKNYSMGWRGCRRVQRGFSGVT